MKKVWISVMLLIVLNPLLIHANDENDSVTDHFELNNQQETPNSTAEVDDLNQGLEIESEVSTNERPGILVLSFQLFFSLVLIIGLIYGLLKLFNRIGKQKNQTTVLNNLGGLSLGSNKSIQLIKVGERVYLIGVGNDVTLIDELKDAELIDKIDANDRSSRDELKFSFLKDLKSKWSQKDNDEHNEQAFASLFKGEVDAMRKKRQEIHSVIKEDMNHD
ncbi:flagellar protein FliO/FliZ [Amphibacillus marinus]|uniref:Flagellar protein FliO/FliZ n=1 Tax=Amphibacillus marinus TaxID=872970 RepID=A0A1H8HQX0_9BACI|nr:flagellar biosynthetic protein FliO [Amphibacillus marinus]SEN58437.1 flagellar protein FliO/FliZ [Amphibacillus marinus]